MNLCVDCKQHVLIYRTLREDVHGCNRDKLHDPVDGKEVYRYCVNERSSPFMLPTFCGPWLSQVERLIGLLGVGSR